MILSWLNEKGFGKFYKWHGHEPMESTMYDDDDGYEYRQRKKTEKEKEKKWQAKKLERELVRYSELSHDEVKQKGGELLNKLLNIIPEHFGKRVGDSKDGIVFYKEGGQKIRISLGVRPIAVVNFVVEAFKVKGWGAIHSFDDGDQKMYDYIELALPKDWLKRVLGIGKFKPMAEIATEKKEEEVLSPAPEQPKERKSGWLKKQLEKAHETVETVEPAWIKEKDELEKKLTESDRDGYGRMRGP